MKVTMEADYRLSKSREEIFKILNLNFEKGFHYIIWQKDNSLGNDRNFKVDLKIKEIDNENGRLYILVEEDDLEFFDPAKEVYFLLKEQYMAFKTKVSFQQSKNKREITLQIPKEVRLKEMRREERTYFKEDDNKNVVAIFKSQEDGTRLRSRCRVYNISPSGICIIITKETFCSIEHQEKIKIEGLDIFENQTPSKMAIMRNARVFSKKTLNSDEFIALGLQFNSETDIKS